MASPAAVRFGPPIQVVEKPSLKGQPGFRVQVAGAPVS